MGKAVKDQRGFSIVELLVALTLTSVIIAAIIQVYVYSGRAAMWGGQSAQTYRDGRLAMMRMARDFRQAGLIAIQDVNGDPDDIFRDVAGQSFSDSLDEIFEEASWNCFTFQGDVDNDNSTETVRYCLEGTQLKRYVWGWSRPTRNWVPEIQGRVVANNVDFVMFTYFDGGDLSIPNPIPDPYQGLTLTRAQRTAIRLIGVDLVIRSEREDLQKIHTGLYPDNTTYDDGFLRQHLASIIQCRNLQ